MHATNCIKISATLRCYVQKFGNQAKPNPRIAGWGFEGEKYKSPKRPKRTKRTWRTQLWSLVAGLAQVNPQRICSNIYFFPLRSAFTKWLLLFKNWCLDVGHVFNFQRNGACCTASTSALSPPEKLTGARIHFPIEEETPLKIVKRNSLNDFVKSLKANTIWCRFFVLFLFVSVSFGFNHRLLSCPSWMAIKWSTTR